MEIAGSVLSFTDPGASFGDPGINREVAREANEYLAGLVARHPRRFGAFAVLPLPHVPDALAELAYALDRLALDGVILLSNYRGLYPGAPELEPLFAELSRRRTPVLLHPSLPPNEAPLPYYPWILEFVFDTTRAVAHLIYSGTLDRHPDIPIIVAHGGGTVPHLSFRLDMGQRIPRVQLAHPVLHYLRSFYYDTTFATGPEALAALTQLVEPSHLLFGSDFPFGPEFATRASRDDLERSPLLDAAARNEIYRGSALRLFARLAARQDAAVAIDPAS
jgi:predicted TIM-barrel fold metal-dependent hydrolase